MRSFSLFLTILFVLLGAPARGQNVQVQIDTVPLETLRLSDFDPINPAATSVFFVITLVNDDQPRDLRVDVVVTAANAGYLGTASTELGVVPPNATIVKTNQEFESYEIGDAAEMLADFALERGLLPPDEYQFQVTVVQHTDGGDIIIGEEDDSIITTNPGTNLDLVGPGTEFLSEPDILTTPQPIFQWLSNANSFELSVFEVRSGQISPEDVATNLPVFTADELNQETFAYPSFAEQLRDGVTYAWQVNAVVTTAAGDIRFPSEMFWFTYSNPAAVDDDGEPNVFVKRVAVEPQETTLKPGEMVRLSADIFDANDALVLNVNPEWRVVPADAGEVTSEGVFTASQRAGAAAVIARVGDVEDYATVLVEETVVETARDSIFVTVLTPTDGQVFPEPAPGFAWQVSNADSSFKNTFLLTVYGPVDEDNPDTAPVFWRHNISGITASTYPASVPALDSGSSYQASVSAIDDRGNIVATSDRVSFSILHDPKISWEVMNAWDVARRQQTDSLFTPLLLTVADIPLQPGVRADIEATGAVVQSVSGPWVQLAVPFHQIDALAGIDGINVLNMPAPHVLFSDGAGSADATDSTLDARPLPGKAPVKVAIFEFGFDQSAIANLVGGRVTYHSFRADGEVGGSNTVDALHGLASVQALFEHLPRTAEVHLINFDTEPEFQDALSYAVNDLGVDIITCSVSWANAYDHYDGTSFFSRSTVEMIEGKTTMAVAAGNFAQSHWEGPYRDSNLNGAHDFSSNGDYLEVQLDHTKRYTFVLSWDDWGSPGRNLDMEILNERGERLADAFGRPYASRNAQSTDGYVEPVERIRNFQPFYPGIRTYRLRVTSPNRTSPSESTPSFELYIYPPPVNASPAPDAGSSLASGLATARSSAIIPVGASEFDHSSQGPTNDGRVRPDFSTSGEVQLNQAVFEGTSFATPRVAAVIASVKSMHPDWSTGDVMDFIQETVTSSSDFTQKSNTVGWGSLDIEALMAKLNGE